MPRVLMPQIKRKKPRITIPGGWIARIPSVTLPRSEADAYINYFVHSKGMSPVAAERHITEVMQNIFTKGWLLGLREMLILRAIEYKELFGTLEGFDPETLQAAYVPGENTGRAGKPVVRKMLLLMGEEAGLALKGVEAMTTVASGAYDPVEGL